MALRTEATILPPTDLACPHCGWHDRKLRVVGSHVTPEERLQIHQWAHHGLSFPWMTKPPPDKS